MVTDRRVTQVEQHYVELFRRIESARIRHGTDDDATVFTSDIPHPLFSGAVAARFAPGAEKRRAGELLDRLMDNGQPFQWWAGPTSHSGTVDECLGRRGLVSEGANPGMHFDLRRDDLPPSGQDIRVAASPDEHRAAMTTFLTGFGMPLELLAPFDEVIGSLNRSSGEPVALLHAYVDDVPAGTGLVVVVDGVAGLYNIAVVPDARRRGLGRSITAALLRMAQEAGCQSAILHASEMGYPVYRALGFEHVCDVRQHVWFPPTA